MDTDMTKHHTQTWTLHNTNMTIPEKLGLQQFIN